MNNTEKRLLYKSNHEGNIFPTNNHGDVIVIHYENKRNILVRFTNTGYEKVVEIKELLNGTIKDHQAPSVCGVGVIGVGFTKEDHRSREYQLWYGVIGRCYDIKHKSKRPTYEHCEASENFKYFPYFKEWCSKQVGFSSVDEKGKYFHLDKDILIKGNKLYSDDTCCFVPPDVNVSFTKTNALRGEYPIGVQYYKAGRCFRSFVGRFGKRDYLGQFNTAGEAFQAYKNAKESYNRELAIKWKDQIDPRVYTALMNYQVEITD